MRYSLNTEEAPAPGDIVVEEARTVEGVVSLKAEWDALLKRSESDVLFLTHEWAGCWLRHFTRPNGLYGRLTPYVLTARKGGKDGRLIGIAPFSIEEIRGLFTAVRSLIFLGQGPSDYSDIVAERGLEAEVSSAFAAHIAGSKAWDVADLREFYGGSATLGVFMAALRANGLTVGEENDSTCSFVPVDRSWEEYLRSRYDSQKRNRLRREWKALSSTGDVRIRFIGNTGEEGLFKKLSEVERGHPDPGRQPILSVEPWKAFYHEALSTLGEAGWLSIALMEIDGSPSAFYIAFRYSGRYYLYTTSYLDNLRKLGAGKLLMMRMLEEYWGSHGFEIDFLRGEEGYKADWTTGSRTNKRVRTARTGVSAHMRSWIVLRLKPGIGDRIRRARRLFAPLNEGR